MAFFYHQSELRLGSEKKSVSLAELCREHATPLYVYDLKEIEKRAVWLKEAFAGAPMTAHYAMKANANSEVLRKLKDLGLSIDTVSAGEIDIALKAGFNPSQIIFSGVGKTKAEIGRALELGIKQINVESPAELERIIELARAMKKNANVAFRMNPDVSPQTHPYITTGFRENKFGMDESFLPELKALLKNAGDCVTLKGLTLHIGSQLLELKALDEAIGKTAATYRALQAEGFEMGRLDIGGGLGINYDTADESPEQIVMQAYGKMAKAHLLPLGCEILTEPGRTLVGRSGILLAEIQYIKKTKFKNFAILNTGMHHLLRPALYQAQHRIYPIQQKANCKLMTYDVVGPICESSDFIGRDISLPELKAGELLAIMDVGAYGYSMASHYNAHALPREIAI
jgi:diaminopimelate decarboxylase